MSRILRLCSWIRLALVAALLGAVLAVPGAVGPDPRPEPLVVSLLVGVGAVGVTLLRAGTTARGNAAWRLVLADAGLVAALVAASGGPRALGNALWVVTIVTASLLGSRRTVLLVAGAAAVSGAGMLAARPLLIAGPPPDVVDVLTALFNGTIFLLVAVAAGGLADRIRASERHIGSLEAVRDLIFDSVTSGLVTVDSNRRITAINRAAQALIGRPAEQVLGHPWAEAFTAVPPFEAIEAALAAGPRRSSQHDLEHRRPDGAAVVIRATFSALRAPEGTRLGLIAVCEDVEDLRRTEAAARRADRLAGLGRMAANMAHEIRNPLAALTAAAEVLTRPSTSSELRPRLADIVRRESARLDRLIADFLGYARPTPPELSPGDLADTLDDVLRSLQHEPLPGGLTIVRDYGDSLPWRFDSQQLRRALRNLCLNAVQAMPDGGELRVAASADADRLILRVADTGPGLEADEVGHVFEPFHGARTGEPGLGLALTHRIVTAHGGDIEVTSTPGAGTAFTLTLPRPRG